MTPPSPAVIDCQDGATPRRVAACHRPEPDLPVVEATANTVACDLPSDRISIQSSSDNDATGYLNDHPNCSEIKEVMQEILTEVVSLSMTKTFWSAGYPHQEDLATSCGGRPKDIHVSSAPVHLEESTGQAVGQPTDPTESRQDVGRTSSFHLTRRPGRTPCHPSKGTPGVAHVSKVTVAPHAKGPLSCTSKTAEAEVIVQRNDHHQ